MQSSLWSFVFRLWSQMEQFGKQYKLCSKKIIESLFSEGKQLRSFPFTVYFREVELTEDVSFQIVISAPKRQFKRAHDRNRVKRLMRETIRKKKLILESELQKQQKQIALFVIYTQRELPVYIELLSQTEKLMNKLTSALADEK